MYSEKTTNFCKIATVDLSYVTTVKSTLEILQDFVAFSEYMNFKVSYYRFAQRFEEMGFAACLPSKNDVIS